MSAIVDARSQPVPTSVWVELNAMNLPAPLLSWVTSEEPRIATQSSVSIVIGGTGGSTGRKPEYRFQLLPGAASVLDVPTDATVPSPSALYVVTVVEPSTPTSAPSVRSSCTTSTAASPVSDQVSCLVGD